MNELAIKRDDDDDVLFMWNAWEQWKGAQVVSFLTLYALRETRTRYVCTEKKIHMDYTYDSYDKSLSQDWYVPRVSAN